eukprot:TRINITY_DN16098_c0_g1_i1.p2 TRINITY_DN16098_c0_g1~~TRINITY_DN16098_c0_g1_i1.p2  ORF type:complete len:325 (+),score=171.90 TRINITY_DN16098_c0_g1_i1:60-1034(+)
MQRVARSAAPLGKVGARWNSGVGFIGLGNMGANMAKHLIAFEGRDLVVFDTNPAAADELVAAGAKFAATPKELAEQCSTVITMLPSGPVLDKVYREDGGVFHGVNTDALLIDASTTGPVWAKEIAEKVVAQNKGLDFVDAPVSGGVPGAAAATLSFMCGARDEAVFNNAKQYLDKMGKNIVNCGPVGAGQTVKVANNLLLAASMIAVSEAMLIGTKLGCDPKVLANVLNTSTGRCWSSDTYNPFPNAIDNDAIPSARGYSGGFACDLMKKDLGLACEAGEAAGLKLTAGAEALEFYSKMSEAGMGNLDFSGSLKFIEEVMSKNA